MLIIVIILVFIPICLISYFGDYEREEIERDYVYFNNLINRK